jgi:arylsulfatase A-like enzyme
VSRASIITGQFERRHRIDDFAKPLDAAAFSKSFPVVLRAAGYRSGFIGKWGLGGPLPEKDYDFFRGFSGQGRYFEEGRPHLTRRQGDLALEFLDGAGPERPFCLQVSFKAPHCQDGDPWQFQFDPRHASLYADAAVPVPASATAGAFASLPEFLQRSEARARWEIRFANPELYQRTVKDYYRLVSGIDEEVGRVMEKLREKKLDDDTVIVFSSDNGFFLGEHGLAGKWFAYEESIRIPLLIADPRFGAERRGKRCDAVALNIDLAPSFLDLAGLAVPESVQGRSLLPLVRGETPPWREELFYEHRFEHPKLPKSEALRQRRWKYVRYYEASPIHEELYDLDEDPLELHNLAAEPRHRERLEALRRRCLDYGARLGR